MIRRRLLLFASLLLGTTLFGANLTVSIHNGSKHAPGSADLVTLLDPNQSMSEIASAENVSGTVVFDGLTDSSQQQYVIQARYNGINYSAVLKPDRSQSDWQQTITVYDVVPEIGALQAEIPFYVIYAFQDRLYIQKRLVLTNTSNPPVSYYNTDGTARVHLPADILQLDYLTIKNGDIPIQAELINTEAGQVLAEPLKPGLNEIDMAYYVPYNPTGTEISETVYYDVDNMQIYTMPMDLKISLPGLIPVGTDPANGVAIYTLEKVMAGVPLHFTISGAGLSETGEQQGGNRIVVESRMDLNMELVIGGLLIVLLIAVLIYSLFRQQGDLKDSSRLALEERKNVLLEEYAALADRNSSEAEALLNQMIAVYKTLERF